MAAIARVARLGFEVRVELLPGRAATPVVAQLSRAEAEALEVAVGQIVHVRAEPLRQLAA